MAKSYLTFESIANLVEQMRIQSNTIDSSNFNMALLRKRTRSKFHDNRADSIRRLKHRSACKACGAQGHWYRDRKECMDKMKHRRERSWKSTSETRKHDSVEQIKDKEAEKPETFQEEDC